MRADHVLAIDDRGLLAIFRWLGSRDGGRFEIPMVITSALGPDGLIQRIDAYSLDQLEEARARFEQLRPDPLRIPPNAATRAGDRWLACAEKRDWEAVAVLFVPGLEYEDRRRLFRITGDRDMAMASMREIASLGARPSTTLLATAGDRLALHHILFSGGDGESEFEVDTLQLTEVDAEGRFVAVIAFDADDRRAAAAEMRERFARSDAAQCVPAAVFEAMRALNAHDIERLRAALPDDFILNDQRRTGLGRLEREDYLASLAALFEQAPDASVETLYLVAVEKHGMLVVARNFGTLQEGGEFESVYVRMALFRDGRIVRAEMFELEELDRARARFAELSERAP